MPQEYVDENAAQIAKYGSIMLESIGERLMITKQFFFTEKMFERFEVPYKKVELSAGMCLIVQPGSAYQSISSSSSRSATVMSLSRTSLWVPTGGASACIMYAKRARVYNVIRSSVDHMYGIGDEDEATRERHAALLTKQFPEAAIDILVTTLPAPALPHRVGFIDTEDDKKAMDEHGEQMCNLTKQSLTIHYDEQIDNAIDKLDKVRREGKGAYCE